MAAATQILDYVLIVPQSVLVHQYWQEIRTGLEKASVPLHHFVLHAERDELVRRIESDASKESADARGWRLDHLDDYAAAHPWHRREAHIIDSTGLQPHQVAALIAAETGIAVC